MTMHKAQLQSMCGFDSNKNKTNTRKDWSKTNTKGFGVWHKWVRTIGKKYNLSNYFSILNDK